MPLAKPLQVSTLACVCGLQAWCVRLPRELGERPKGPHISCLEEAFFHVPLALLPCSALTNSRSLLVGMLVKGANPPCSVSSLRVLC